MINNVMMKITIQNAILMVELVAIITLQDGTPTALIANAYRVKQQQQPLCKIMKIVVHPNGLMTTTVTMKIILQNAILMVELVVITILQGGTSSALIANAYR